MADLTEIYDPTNPIWQLFTGFILVSLGLTQSEAISAINSEIALLR